MLNIANDCKSNPDEYYFTLLRVGFSDLTINHELVC